MDFKRITPYAGETFYEINPKNKNEYRTVYMRIQPILNDLFGLQYQERIYYDKKSKLVNRGGNIVNTQYNRVVYFQISRAPKWSFTLTQDFTSAYEGAIPVDPYYNPLEALISGDFKYFTGSRNTVKPPSWINNRWISAEFSYNITSSQRISVMYGSIQGGLFCSNGVCRVIPAFNDGFKVAYSASF